MVESIEYAWIKINLNSIVTSIYLEDKDAFIYKLVYTHVVLFRSRMKVLCRGSTAELAEVYEFDVIHNALCHQ